MGELHSDPLRVSLTVLQNKMRLLFSVISWIVPVAIFADQPKALFADEAAEHGFTLQKLALNPGVVQIAATLPQGTKSVGLIIRGADGQFISSSALEIRDNRCSAIIVQSAITNSSFVIPYIANSEDEMTEIHFAKTMADGTGQPAIRPESK
jgi:hypothetical protein